ncbi:MAG: lipopolysaccharide biosynthesis protein [Hyphomicrobium sp.]
MTDETGVDGGGDIRRRKIWRRIWLPDAGSAIWALADQALVSGAAFLTGIFVARLLGVEEFGRFVLAIIIAIVAQNVHGALITGPIMTIAPSQRAEDRRDYLGAVLLQQAVYALAASLLVYAAAMIIDGVVPAWRVAAIAAPLALFVWAGSFSDFWRHYFYASANARTSALCDGVRYTVQGGLLAFLYVRETFGVAAVLLAMALAAALSGGLGFVVAERAQWCRLRTRQVAKEHWTLSKWLLASAATGSAREGVVAFVTGAVLGLADVGLLRAAQQLVLAVNVPLQGLGKIAQARASHAYATAGSSGLSDVLQGFMRRYLLGIGGVLALLALAGEPLAVLVYGRSYSGAGLLISAYALVMMIYLGREALTVKVRAMRRPSIETHAGLAAAAFSLAALYPLLKLLGPLGAIGAEAIFNIVALWALRRYETRITAAPHDAGQD